MSILFLGAYFFYCVCVDFFGILFTVYLFEIVEEKGRVGRDLFSPIFFQMKSQTCVIVENTHESRLSLLRILLEYYTDPHKSGALLPNLTDD